jgi:hypothetical protein
MSRGGQLPGDEDIGRIVRQVMADPAVQAAADQLHAATAGPLPGQDDPAAWDERRDEAIRMIVHTTLRRWEAELGPLTADVLAYVAGLFQVRKI